MLSKSPLFSIGFRPFFILASLLALINPAMWASNLIKGFELPLYVSPLFWHGHEMLFGYTSAIIAGFILTASANWTKTKPYLGLPLITLSLLWITERVIYFIDLKPIATLVFTNVFYPVLIVMLFFKVKDHSKQRNVFIPLLSLIFLSSLTHSYGYLFSNEDLEISSLGIGVSLITLLLFLIAGRVLPFFTRSKTGIEVNVSSLVHKLSLLPLLLLCLPIDNLYYLSIVLSIACMTNSYRNYLMLRKEAFKVPMLLVLHSGLFFLTFSLFIRLLSLYFPEINDNREVIHLTLVGGLGLISLGIMTRVSLGHTGREIKASKLTIVAYASIFIAAILRSFVPYFFPDYYDIGVYVASKFWSLGFIIFVITYGKILTIKRADQN